MSNRITIELCEEDRKRLDGLFLMAAELVNDLKSKPNLVGFSPYGTITFSRESEGHPDPVGKPGPPGVPGEPAETPAAEPEQPKYSKADVLALVQKLAAPNSPNREQAKAIVKQYGAKVSDIPEDKYAEVMAKLSELEV